MDELIQMWAAKRKISLQKHNELQLQLTTLNNIMNIIWFSFIHQINTFLKIMIMIKKIHNLGVII
jgi:hypothetical protein